MFISTRELFQQADENGSAIGAFNTNNLEVTEAIVGAANELKLPLLIQTTPSAIKYAGLKEIFTIVKTAIDESQIPMAIHLDHGDNIEIVKQCLEIGYKSVMFDGSKLPFEENVAETKKVVELAHQFGAFVEGEIGVVSRGESGVKNAENSYTDPEEASQFAKLTGVNSLAVSVGNVHGAPSGEKLNIDLIKEIHKVVPVPLVLHGASGLSKSDISAAISAGIRKINIDTQLRKAFQNSVAENAPKPEMEFRQFLEEATFDTKQVVKKYLKIFNALE